VTAIFEERHLRKHPTYSALVMMMTMMTERREEREYMCAQSRRDMSLSLESVITVIAVIHPARAEFLARLWFWQMTPSVPSESCHLFQNHAAVQCCGILPRAGMLLN